MPEAAAAPGSEGRPHEFRIELGLKPGRANRILLDGRPLGGVTQVLVSAGVGDVPRVSITFIPRRVEVDGVGEVWETTSLGDEWRRYVAGDEAPPPCPR